MNSVLIHPTTSDGAIANTYHSSILPAVSEDTAGPRKGRFPIESAVRTPHGLSIIKTRWVGGHWEHRVPSHSQPGAHHLTTRHTCDCWGFQRHGHCYHLDSAATIEDALHEDVWYALRYLRPCNSMDEYCYGLGLLSRLGLDEATAREVINGREAVA